MHSKSISGRLTTNFVWTLLSEFIGKGGFFVANIYLARNLGVANFGLFTLAQAVTFYMWLAVDLGTTMYGIREISRHKENPDGIINLLFTMRVVGGCGVFLVYCLIISQFNFSSLEKLTFIGCGLYLVTYSLYADWVLKGLELFKYVFLGNLCSSAFYLTGIFFLTKTSEDVALAGVVWSLSYFFGSVFLIFCIFRKIGLRYKPIFNFPLWVQHIRQSIYFTLAGLLMTLYQYLPIVFLNIYFGTYEVGIFSASYRVVSTICSIGFFLPMAFFPIISELYLKDRRAFLKSNTIMQGLMLAAGMAICLIGMLFGSEILLWLFGAKYTDSIRIFKILIWLVVIIFLRFSLGISIIAADRQKLHMFSCGGAFLLGLVLSLILIPKYSTCRSCFYYFNY